MPSQLERPAELQLLDDLLAQHPVTNALELDPEGRRLLEQAQPRIPRVCRVPADPGRKDAPYPGERFDLVTAFGLLTVPEGQRDITLTWARQRLREHGRLVVSARPRHRDELPDTSRWVPRHHRAERFGPDEAEDVLADAGFVVEHVEPTTTPRPWTVGQAGALLAVATLA